MFGSKVKYVLQVTVGTISKLYNLSSNRVEARSEYLDNLARKNWHQSEIQELGSIEDLKRFGNPEEYIETGYCCHKRIENELNTKQTSIMTTVNGETYLVRTKILKPDSNLY